MISLSAASAAAVCASIFSLATSDRAVSTIDLGATVFSLITLVLSLIVSTLNYQSRARNMFFSFREIQRISARLEALRHFEADPTRLAAEVASLEIEYQNALDKSENHTTQDYRRVRPARDDESVARRRWEKSVALVQQGFLTAIPVSFIIASVIWLLFVFSRYKGLQ